MERGPDFNTFAAAFFEFSTFISVSLFSALVALSLRADVVYSFELVSKSEAREEYQEIYGDKKSKRIHFIILIYIMHSMTRTLIP